jgi:RNA polymerase sigma-70 factor (ECF subfamily)
MASRGVLRGSMRALLDTPPHSPQSPHAPDLPALLRAAGAGDDRAWRAIIDLYARRVYALVKSRVGPGRHDLAEEVTQSVFVTVATKLSGRVGEEGGAYVEQGKFESWLFRIVMNRLRDEIRRQRRHAEPTDPSSAVFVSADTEGADPDMPEDLRRLREAIGSLSEADRQVVELRHHAGMSFKQISELLDEPLGTLLARHHRALKKLKDLMTGNTPPTAARPA